jgi:hypothetical protein
MNNSLLEKRNRKNTFKEFADSRERNLGRECKGEIIKMRVQTWSHDPPTRMIHKFAIGVVLSYGTIYFVSSMPL